jgi:hypothetical protein
MIRLIWTYWQDAIMVNHTSGNYGQPFKAGHRVTQGGLLSARLFNILVDAVVRKWYLLLKTQVDYEAAELDELIATFFAFLQQALFILVDLFGRVGLLTNMKKTHQVMICKPGRIRTQLPFHSYCQMMRGHVSAAEWNARQVGCRQCGWILLASSLSRHFADVHNIYQVQVVPEELLEDRPPAIYTITHSQKGKLVCPFPCCEGILNDGWNLRCHF